MLLTKPEQDLKRDLQGIASDLKWSAVELLRIAERLGLAGNDADAQAVLRMTAVLRAGENKLDVYAEEVRSGRFGSLVSSDERLEALGHRTQRVERLPAQDCAVTPVLELRDSVTG